MMKLRAFVDSLLRGRARSQRGAVLYVVLVVLVLLALIGIVGMQVATMQERMSANYLAANMAFQRAESLVRDRESTINNGAEYEYQNCLVPYDPVAWVNSIGKGVVADVLTRNISICMQQCSASAGSDRSESGCNMFRITVFSRDRNSVDASSSLSSIDTIFVRP
ncbi:pilus assembly PilX family protein [Xylella fastidiosa]|uniref:Fimbrial protein n=1 Tax=Xylella fastidiosa subsp. sandyi Ann-1 TaxID=155920 RepID=A0A060H4E8_XYLFS|nr:PilX N-terminal domain-containing pilus assembly protein [Xylella fastidiosa]AIC10200.1 fimbrial protein [Xylella fastidiosa subsp. sandyi Ann-1]UIX82129.1 PilX N-terminal domain-containing pilus assembly protein [Xylella fastidiosa subsp. sandyi]